MILGAEYKVSKALQGIENQDAYKANPNDHNQSKHDLHSHWNSPLSGVAIYEVTATGLEEMIGLKMTRFTYKAKSSHFGLIFG